MHKEFLKTGVFFAMLSVILGAFAAHAIKSRVTVDVLAVFETGVRYQMYHSFALLLSGILYKEFAHKTIIWAGKLFLLGILLFSGSLYLLTYVKAISASSFLWIGAITPFGGLAFIGGWVLLLVCLINKKNTHH